MKIPPHVQMWVGAIGALYFLSGAIVTAMHATVTADWLKAYSAFCAGSLLAWIAWRGYQRRPKTGPSREI
jgi:hypothetical protein